MADTAASPQAPAVTGTAHAKKTSGGQKKSKNPRAKPNHPPTSEMVNNAIKNLKERGGSSLQAIKKYISANYKVDAEKLSPFIKKYLKAAVASGGLVQTKGKGASGSFKLSSGSSVAKPASGGGSEKSPSSKPKAGAKKSAGAAAKAKTPTKKPHAAGKAKAVSEKKTVAAKARKAPSEKKSAKAPKSPSKAKRSNKGPTKKPKAPKPKRTKPTGGSSPSKAASKKVAASSGTPVKKK